MPHHTTGPDDDTLNGWREIAFYLGKSVRTAQRWEAVVGLPVQRITDPDGLPVVTASRRAIDAWRRTATNLPANLDWDLATEAIEAQATADTDPLPEVSAADGNQPTLPVPDDAMDATRSLRPWASGMALALLAGLAAGAAFATAFMPETLKPTRFVVEGAHVVALTDTDERAWTHPLKSTARWPDTAASSMPPQGDLDGDGIAEVVVAITFARPDTISTESDAVLVFSRNGRLWWTVQPATTSDEAGKVAGGPGPWRLRSMAIAMKPPRRLWLAYGHDDPGRLGFVLEVTPDGRESVRYVQAGRISSIQSWHTATGDYLVVGGTDTTTSQATLAIVSLEQRATRWGGTASNPSTMETAPAAFFVLPASELRGVLSRTHADVMRLMPVGDQLRVETDEGVRPATLFWVGADLRLREIGRPTSYWVMHRSLEGEGKIRHTVVQCPDSADSSVVRAWRPSSGWTNDAVRVLPNLPGFRLAASPRRSAVAE